MKDQISDTLTTTENVRESVKTVLDINTQPSQSFSTEYRKLRMFRKMNVHFEPIEFTFGRRLQPYDENGSVKLKKIPAGGHFISLKQTLHNVFSDSKLLGKVRAYVANLQEELNVFSNVMRSVNWHKRMKSHRKKFVLPLVIYDDDLESGNPLSSHGGTNAIGVVYVLLACLPPQYASKLSSIYPTLMFRRKDRE